MDAAVCGAQMLSESHSGLLKLAAGFSDSLLGLKRETESLKKVNTELQDSSKHRGTALSACPPHHCCMTALQCCASSCTALSNSGFARTQIHPDQSVCPVGARLGLLIMSPCLQLSDHETAGMSKRGAHIKVGFILSFPLTTLMASWFTVT